ncbi:hypothetical protein JYG23_12105 [Sedimentibacter sp. zth1]|uniref:hypothetical protein n=1 Tax=Sedimentibacter sp. zth1 TaxID=2816908 RepID=UPI001A931E6E|nr:hypothetical protein [Sedimentibacter sp. zth1]QSX05411.1 hypothetical protein JYG23_12105 [Sedimentibacter sp. zth1]
MRNLRYNISESFNIFRWSLVIIIFSFVAVVSVYKYINLSNSVAITYTSLETTYLILNDTISIVYIYLPLYLFTICGLMLNDNFGSIEVLKCGSRGKWIFNKSMTLLFYTLIFFLILFCINFAISHRVFPYSSVWSTDFVKTQVSLGQEVINFTSSPIKTIGASLVTLFFVYLLSGNVSVLVSLITNKESVSLIASLIVGVIISILLTKIVLFQKSIDIFKQYNFILIACIIIIFLVNYLIARKKDFNMGKGIR